MNFEDPNILEEEDSDSTASGLLETTPWSKLHERKIRSVEQTRDLAKSGLVDRESVTSFPDGYLVLWDVSGFTKIMNALEPQKQVVFVQNILRVAVKMALDLGLTMLAPPAGDQGIYFAPQCTEQDQALVIANYMRNELKIQNPLKPSEFCEIKATVIPAEKNALFAVTLLDRDRGMDSIKGYHAVAGKAYVQGLRVLQSAVKNSTTVLSDSVRGIEGRFDVYNPHEISDEGTLSKKLAESVRSVCYPHIPKGPHYYGVFRARKHVDLVDPLHTVLLSQVLFDAVDMYPGVKIQRQDEGYAHLTVEHQPNVDAVIGSITNQVAQALRERGLELKAHWKEVQRPNVFQYGLVQETAGGVVVDIIKSMKEDQRKAGKWRSSSSLASLEVSA